MKKSVIFKITALLIVAVMALSLAACRENSEVIKGNGEETQNYTYENILMVSVPGDWTTEITEKGTVITADTEEFTQGIAFTLIDAKKDSITVAGAMEFMLADETVTGEATETEINGIAATYFDMTGVKEDDEGNTTTVYGRYYLIQADENRIVALALLNGAEADFTFGDSILNSATMVSAE